MHHIHTNGANQMDLYKPGKEEGCYMVSYNLSVHIDRTLEIKNIDEEYYLED